MASLGAIDMKQPALFDMGSPDLTPNFGGETYEPEHDAIRLKGLLARVLTFMSDGQWHTLRQICDACGGTEASCSARLRDLRKGWAGSRKVERQRVAGGLYQYRLAE